MEEDKKVSKEIKPILQKANPYKKDRGEEDAEVEAFARGELTKFQREQREKEAFFLLSQHPIQYSQSILSRQHED